MKQYRFLRIDYRILLFVIFSAVYHSSAQTCNAQTGKKHCVCCCTIPCLRAGACISRWCGGCLILVVLVIISLIVASSALGATGFPAQTNGRQAVNSEGNTIFGDCGDNGFHITYFMAALFCCEHMGHHKGILVRGRLWEIQCYNNALFGEVFRCYLLLCSVAHCSHQAIIPQRELLQISNYCLCRCFHLCLNFSNCI